MSNTSRRRQNGGLTRSWLLRVDNNSDGSTSSGYLSYADHGTYKRIDDNSNGRFALRRKRGECVLSDVSLYEVEIDPGMSGVVLGPVTGWGTVTYSGPILSHAVAAHGPWLSLADDRERAKATLLVKAYAKMNESPLLMGENLAEIHQSVQMLKKPFSGAVDLIAKIARSRDSALRKTNVSLAKATSNAWLEYRYGWKPLILDTQQIIKEVRNSSVKGNGKFKVARTSKRFTKKDKADAYLTGSGLYTTTGVATHEIECDVSAGVIYAARNRSLAGLLAKTSGLDSRSLPSTAWELVPFSFVVDWFVNVGDWLQAVIPDPDIAVIGNWVTCVEKHLWTMGCIATDHDVYLGGSNHNRVRGGFGACSIKERWYDRTVNNPLQLTPQIIGKPLSFLHTVDGLSLMAQRIVNGLDSLRF